ncbi:VOC family protein [uncultured Roseibium sp.]|uniref:VOC family protein n=1 Tax=uncultured Roseibium sp. TaxID=1936171 RepID=UPI00261A967F|nr:VOC family protein [uncultured Roseibium sp.]
MHIHHIAFFSKDISRLKDFYVDLFQAQAGEMYQDERDFRSFMVRFENDTVLELMQMPDVLARATPDHDDIHHVGLHHLAITVASDDDVLALTRKASGLGSAVIKPPELTGDGFFESMVTDPDGNLVEICRAPLSEQ